MKCVLTCDENQFLFSYRATHDKKQLFSCASRIAMLVFLQQQENSVSYEDKFAFEWSCLSLTSVTAGWIWELEIIECDALKFDFSTNRWHEKVYGKIGLL